MEYFTRSLMHAESIGLIKGIQATNKSIAISHLLFADDCMLFFHASDKGIQQIKEILHKFSLLSGEIINFNKSSAFIAGAITPEHKQRILNSLGVKQLINADKYLGLSILLEKSKTKSFASVKDSYEHRLQGWCSKTLNLATRTTLIRSVLDAMPAHYMINFRLPKTLITKLELIQRKFWWGRKKIGVIIQLLGIHSAYRRKKEG
ncbi:uncharacterized protein LOC113296592 [Papaver somniferum]|uniref:uncharacterized protein LOC113296592 n=1 Tax=Papaver somniferum TaxID=3469 RepID=UPI000E6F9A93|nr:uncharacterized protein LOC113296592 [Papaver somniferum]